ncbi:hypothetical protein JOB18_040730 [Solea senegalensis]|uniref:Uncharacterized protein n=1 Tax=Solea senegalensis TaxID=28829 RepID=A0AAV6PYS6_SOLSE|nr:hypothetical protein JOB18_040730 [Solea senegalensis]
MTQFEHQWKRCIVGGRDYKCGRFSRVSVFALLFNASLPVGVCGSRAAGLPGSRCAVSSVCGGKSPRPLRQTALYPPDDSVRVDEHHSSFTSRAQRANAFSVMVEMKCQRFDTQQQEARVPTERLFNATL